MRVTIRELKDTVKSVVTEMQVRQTKTLIETLLNEKSLKDRIAGALGRVNPSLDVDDPKKAKSQIDKALGTAQKRGAAFKQDALADTKRVNDYHDSVKNVIDKVTALGDSLSKEDGSKSEEEMVKVIRSFYDNLRQSMNRLDSYLRTVTDDVGEKGLGPKIVKGGQKAIDGEKSKLSAKPGPANDNEPAKKIPSIDDPPARPGKRRPIPAPPKAARPPRGAFG